MSTWDPHVECACQKGAAAAIFSPNGGVKWGQKHGLCDDVTPAEMFEAFRNAKNTSSATFHGQKYLFINGLTDERIYGFRLGKQSVAIFEAETYCGIVFGKDGDSVPDCFDAVDELKKYMKGTCHQG